MELEVKEAVKKYDQNKRYTYADYAGWDDDERYELIDGEVYAMSAPSTAHQSICMELSRQFANFLVGKQCKVFASPFDICLNGKGDEDDTVVQPDIIIICDESKLDKKRLNGAPDLAIEILSPSTASRDRIVKLNRYLKAGVREYWIVDPEIEGITVNTLENGKYVVSAFESSETIPVSILEGCNISLPDVF